MFNLNYKDIRLSVDNINSYLPALVNKIRKGYKNEIIFELYKKEEKKNLIISLNPSLVSLHISYHSIIFRSDADKLILKLRKIFERKILERVSQQENERLVRLDFYNTSFYIRLIVFPKTPAIGIYDNDNIVFKKGCLDYTLKDDGIKNIRENFNDPVELSSKYYELLKDYILKDYKENRIKKINTALNNLRSTIKKIKGSLEERVDFKNWADILATFYQNDERKGLKQIETYDFYGKEVIIKLNPSLSVKEHINFYYEKAKKNKKATELNKNRILYLENKIKSLEETKNLIESVGIKEVLKEMTNKNKNDIKSIAKINKRFLVYKDENDNVYVVGRNDEENSHLFKIGKPNTYWFHARDYPGSHVLLMSRDKKIENNIVLNGAKLALFYSKAKKFGEGYVMCTLCKYLKRSKGLKKGEVNVLRYKSIYIKLDDFIENKLTKI